jgi:hypothetical protein
MPVTKNPPPFGADIDEINGKPKEVSPEVMGEAAERVAY